MSGSVSTSESDGWCKAGWVFRAILREIITDLRATHAPADMLRFLENPSGVPQVVEHIELPDMPRAWQHLFASAASSAYQRCRAHGFSIPTKDTAVQPILESWRELLLQMRDFYEQPRENA